MKFVLSILLASVLCCVAIAQSQDQGSRQGKGQSGSQATQGSQNQNQTSQTGTSSSQNMSGTVSHNGKNFTNEKNSKKYKVDNPDSLKGKEDQHVALLVQVDPDN